MPDPLSEEARELRQLEDNLRIEAATFLGYFESAEPVLDVLPVPLPNDRPSRGVAAVGTFVTAVVLAVMSSLLLFRPAEHRADTEPPLSVAPSGEVGVEPLANETHRVAEQLRDEYGRKPLLFQLVDEQGAAIGTGLYYPEITVPLDFSELSDSEQQAAFRLLDLESSSVPPLSI